MLDLAYTVGQTGLLAGALALGSMDRNPWPWNTRHALVPAFLLLPEGVPMDRA